MPQLAPLNWMFLMFFFWFMAASIMMMLWWSKDKKFYIYQNNPNMVSKSRWTW